jgi:hypothetical protein
MQLNDRQIAKIDPLLQEALKQATGDELVRAIAVLNTDEVAISAALDPEAFSSRLAYREALIAQRQTQLQTELSATMRSLHDLDLKTDGGSISPVLALEGTARQVLAALDLAGVRHASLEQLIGLPEIVPAESIKHLAQTYIDALRGKIDQYKKQLINQAAQQYILNYVQRHGFLKVLGMREPVKLESVYTGVKFLDEAGILQFLSTDKLEETYRQSKERWFQGECKTQDGIKVADKQQFLMVLGQPGAGKSTFLRRIGLEALKGKKEIARHRCIPVFLELKTFKDQKGTIEDRIVEEFRTCGFPEPEQFTKSALSQGRLLILLDGLDEVPAANINEVIRQIEGFVDRYDKNRFITSCRIAAYRSRFKRFFDVVMADFDDAQIETFINNWFHTEKDLQAGTAQRCRELLAKPEHKAAKELGHTPLLLTFLCLVYDKSQGLPSNRSVLYGKALRILLEEWAAEKRIVGWTVYEGLSIELEELLLAQIAYENFAQDRLFFPKRDLVTQIKTFLASNLNAPQQLDGEAVLNAIAIQQGILVERAEDVFSFSHLTLQEYLTAQYLVDHNEIATFVTAHLTDSRWHEVFTLVAGLMRGGADDLLRAMTSQTQQMIDSPKLLALLTWAHQVTDGSEGKFKPAAKRVAVTYIALALALYLDRVNLPKIAIDLDLSLTAAIDLDRNFNRALVLTFTVDLAVELVLALEKIKIYENIDFAGLVARLGSMKAQFPDRQASWETRVAFAEKMLQTFCQAIHLDRDLLGLSATEIQTLNDYFYANHLIIQCKDAAVRVSPQVWQTIEDGMLMPPSPDLKVN